jgi:putative component of membrane protein insertase Oxa1/YidC/SpoIIIJ protein YidD
MGAGEESAAVNCQQYTLLLSSMTMVILLTQIKSCLLAQNCIFVTDCSAKSWTVLVRADRAHSSRLLAAFKRLQTCQAAGQINLRRCDVVSALDENEQRGNCGRL